jgi:trimethylamine corrinoid protein
VTVAEVRAALPAQVRIVVGGAPFRFDAELWRQVGADAMGRTAADALDIVATLSAEEASR